MHHEKTKPHEATAWKPSLSPLIVMVPHIPEDILLEVVKLLTSDIQTLCSCALTSHAWARGSQPYIFRTVGLTSGSRARSRKLGDVLKKNPSLADYSHELSLCIGHVNSDEACNKTYVDMDDPELPQLLGCFHQLKEVTISCASHSRDVVFPKALVEALARVFALETLRTVKLFEFRSFPISILAHATYVKNLQLYLINLDTQSNPNQTRPTPPFHAQTNSPVRTGIPISLILCRCTPETHHALARLVRERGGLHWIDKLVLLPKYNGRVVDKIGPCCDLLQAVGESQHGIDGKNGLSHFTLTLGSCKCLAMSASLRFQR